MKINLWINTILVVVVVAMGGCQAPPSSTSKDFGSSGISADTKSSLMASTETELLRDPRLLRGVKHGWANTYPENADTQCRRRWKQKVPSLSQSSWLFWEIAEKTYFCDRVDNPTNGAEIVYSSVDNSKQFHDYKDGRFKFNFDTSREWQQGCNLSMPKSGQTPLYGKVGLNGNVGWNWPHFMIGQKIVDPSSLQDKLFIGKYSNLTFNASVKLNTSIKSSAGNCSAGTWRGTTGVLPNHELFKLGIVLRHKNYPAQVGVNVNANVIYALVPMFYSKDGSSAMQMGGWMGGDPVSNVVFYAPNYPHLTLGSWVDFTIDVNKLAGDALAMLGTKYGETFSASDYQVFQVLIGWEIWGGFENEVEVKGLSLKAGSSSAVAR